MRAASNWAGERFGWFIPLTGMVQAAARYRASGTDARYTETGRLHGAGRHGYARVDFRLREDVAGVTLPDESDLVRSAAAGDEAAFTRLVELHIDRCYAIARRITGTREAAEEATQEALVAAWRDLPQLSDAERFAPWLYRILVRQCYRTARWYRKLPGLHRSRRRTDEDQYLEWDVPAAAEGVGVEERDELADAFRGLSLEHRAVVALHFYLDLPLVEVARALDIPPGTARSRLHYALRELRMRLHVDRPEETAPIQLRRGRRPR